MNHMNLAEDLRPNLCDYELIDQKIIIICPLASLDHVESGPPYGIPWHFFENTTSSGLMVNINVSMVNLNRGQVMGHDTYLQL